jgi:hypothetical protein
MATQKRPTTTKRASAKKAAPKKEAGPWVLPSFAVEVLDPDEPAKKGATHFSGDPKIGDYYEAKTLDGRFPAGCRVQSLIRQMT